ncbi:MAG TPA: hypothetical protein VHM20_06750, partial [Gammaproteobacteria bacterium]|nr:hypothetical protein [Gammaproteobacteria bacterium]
QKSIQEQLKHEYKLQEAAILYLDQLVGQLRTPEIEEKTKQLANVKRLMEQRIAFLTTRSEQLSTGKNQRAISSVEGMRQKAEQWVRKIPRIIQQCDDLMMELEKREKHFQTLEKQLNTLNSQTSLNKFPSLGEPRKHLQHLVKKIEKYKKTLVVLGKKTQLEIEELNASIRNCNITMSFIDYKKKFQKIYKALAENYENILAEAMKIEDEINACRKVIVDADTKCGGSLSTEVKLCEQLKEKVQTDKKHFSKCYQTFTLEKSAEFRDEQNRIMRVNCLLQNIYDNLTIIEDEMKKAGHDNRGVILFKKKFASILINNTVHEEDLEKPVKKYLEWLHYLENSEAIHIHSNEYLEAIKRCRRDMIQVRNELIRWRTPTSSYAVSTTMRFFSPAIFTMLGIVIPGANLLPSGLTQNAVLMNHLQTATETVVQVGGKQAYTKVTDTLSPTERGSDFDDPDFTEKKIQLKEKMTVAGKRRIINQPKDDCKLSLDLSYLWRDTLQVQIKKAVFNKSMVLTGISTSISLALGLTGVGTPLALGLLVAGTAAGNMSLVAFDEYQQCVEEARIRFQTEERLKEIGDAIQSLERFPERHILNKYFLFTMDFIVKLIIHMRVEKEDLNVDMSLQQMLDYLVVILNIPSADLLPTTTSETNIEVKRQDLAPLLDFLKTEVEGKEGLQTTIQFLNSAHSTTDAKTLETKLMIARQHILKLEKILKILDIHCAVGK